MLPPINASLTDTKNQAVTPNFGAVNVSTGINIPGWVWILLAILIPGGGIVYLIWRLARKKKRAKR